MDSPDGLAGHTVAGEERLVPNIRATRPVTPRKSQQRHGSPGKTARESRQDMFGQRWARRKGRRGRQNMFGER
ncbi:hypothetical protein E2C01_073425 [Portunus trituberculatus]|uniref:Uncharacterized protein n=1 Tax=Portunus trituberculatus TaxID=210409 RepID=A0A5B7IDI1_PORTR|nr:hypothetical protein [Portunus trituberculatus]